MTRARPTRIIVAALSGALVLAVAAPARAHHGFEGRDDLSQPPSIEGEVVRTQFGQPHPVLTIRTAADRATATDVPDLAGAGSLIDIARLAVRAELRSTEVAVELSPVRRFLALDGTIAVGSRIAVIAFRNREAPHDRRGNRARPEGSPAVARPRGSGHQVQGCRAGPRRSRRWRPGRWSRRCAARASPSRWSRACICWGSPSWSAACWRSISCCWAADAAAARCAALAGPARLRARLGRVLDRRRRRRALDRVRRLGHPRAHGCPLGA